MIRRIVTPTWEDGRVMALAVQAQEIAEPADGAVAVRVDLALFDPEPYAVSGSSSAPAAAFVGTVVDGPSGAGLAPGDRVAGLGPLADLVVVPPDSILPIGTNREAAPDVALAILEASLREALGTIGITPGERVLVSGRGLGAWLAERQAQVLSGGSVQRVSEVEPRRRGSARARGRAQSDEGAFDVLVDASADSTQWAQVLPQVRRNGRVLLLLPPGEQVRTFDFYPRVHKGSCSLRACRWPSGRAVALHDGALFPPEGVFTADIIGTAAIPMPPGDALAVVCRFFTTAQAS